MHRITTLISMNIESTNATSKYSRPNQKIETIPIDNDIESITITDPKNQLRNQLPYQKIQRKTINTTHETVKIEPKPIPLHSKRGPGKANTQQTNKN